MKNNLFTYGTSELTHDAILCWILSWANNPEHKLYGLADEFINLLVSKKHIDYSNVTITKQYENIDIFIEIDDHSVIVIEDKVYSQQHGDQLTKYKNKIEILYPNRKKYFNYVTVGDEGDYNNIERKGYKVITRSDILHCLENYKEDSEIVMEYYNYLNDIEVEVNKYKTKEIIEWGEIHWQGFYTSLQSDLAGGKWGTVNPSNGESFSVFYWNSSKHLYKNVSYEIYLQIEQAKITFRVSTKENNSEIRNMLWNTLSSILPENSNIKRPKRFGTGNTMAFAVIDNFNSVEDIEEAMIEMDDAKKILEELIDLKK